MSRLPVIVAYDGSPNSHDAVALGGVLARACEAPLMLASVYRSGAVAGRNREAALRERERFMNERTQELLAEGAREVSSALEVRVEAVGSETTATGIRTLAERERALIVVFGSARGTLPAHVHPGSASRRLLQRLEGALALAPAGFSANAPETLSDLAVAGDEDGHTVWRSAQTLAELTGARLADTAGASGAGEEPGLLLLGSGEQAREGQLMLNARGSELIQTARIPVLVLPRGRALLAQAERSAAVA